MTGREVVALIKANSGVTWNERSFRDTFKAGNPDSQVKGIASTMMTTFDVLKRANEAGLNMVISHEDTYWNDPDDTKDLTANPLYKAKTEYIREERHDRVAQSRWHARHETRFHRAGIAARRRHPGRR